MTRFPKRRRAGSAVSLTLALLLMPASPASAQDATRIDPAPGAVQRVRGEGEAAAARALAQFTACSARSRRRAAEAVLELPFGSREQARAGSRMFHGGSDCFRLYDRELRASPVLVVGGLAQYLVRTDYDEAALARVSGLTDESVLSLGLTPRNANEDLALCTVRRDARGAWAVLATDPVSDEEDAALRRLVPHLQRCLPAGMTINFDSSALRAILAGGLYRALRGTR